MKTMDSCSKPARSYSSSGASRVEPRGRPRGTGPRGFAVNVKPENKLERALIKQNRHAARSKSIGAVVMLLVAVGLPALLFLWFSTFGF